MEFALPSEGKIKRDGTDKKNAATNKNDNILRGDVFLVLLGKTRFQYLALNFSTLFK